MSGPGPAAEVSNALSVVECRICGSERLFKYLSLGSTPLANRLLRVEELGSRETFYPLEVLLCEECGLSQLTRVVPPEALFSEYIYVTSTSELAVHHARWLAESMVARFSLTDSDRIVEIGSNDGCVLKAFRQLGVRTLGVEPARNIAALARADGIDTVSEFFDSATAATIRRSHGAARVIIGRHVLAHVHRLRDFVEGLLLLLADNGIAMIEVPYLVDLLERTEYDTIYHEHLSYFSVRALTRLFGDFGMEIFDVQRVGIHGGSIIVFVQRTAGPARREPSGEALRQEEAARQLDRRTPYLEFAQRVERSRTRLNEVLAELKAKEKRIWGYGAAAKGNTLLNYCGIDQKTLDCVLDKSPLKHNLYTPGTHIPIEPAEALDRGQPDYLLILAWNFASEIMDQQAEYKRTGGRFIIPVPEARIV
jgi:novobiocin biosynthesis protein NovU/D-mycarose 3-C-methyltransferase